MREWTNSMIEIATTRLGGYVPTMRAYVIEAEGNRLVVVESRFGGYSLDRADVADLIDTLLDAQLRMLDPTPLDPPESRRQSTVHSPPTRNQTIEDIL